MKDRKLIINLAPTGMVPTKALTPHAPLTRDEIVADIVECAELGVSMVHLHARDENGTPTHDAETVGALIGEIRERRPDLVIVASTSGRQAMDFETRASALELKGDLAPDMASLTLTSMNFQRDASVNSPDMVRRLAQRMAERGIKPELEIFDLGMLNYARYLIDKGILQPPFYFNFMLGNIASAQATLLHLATLLADLPPDSLFALSGIGRYQKRMNETGVIWADGVRVGLEDNIWYDEGRSRLATNRALVERVVNLCAAAERRIANPLEVRAALRLPGLGHQGARSHPGA